MPANNKNIYSNNFQLEEEILLSAYKTPEEYF